MIDRRPEFRVRAASPCDAAPMTAVIHAAYAEFAGRLDPPSGAHKETESSVRSWFDAGGAGVAETNGALVGLVHFAPLPGALYLGRLAVLPAWRNRGIGRELVAFVEGEAKARGLPHVTLGVRIQLPDNRAFYEALGYAVVAQGCHTGYTKPTYFTMEKILAPAAQDGMIGG